MSESSSGKHKCTFVVSSRLCFPANLNKSLLGNELFGIIYVYYYYVLIHVCGII